ncbi:MAG: hypothetical protein ACRETX_07330, partial [Steroidobacteraceae bacterium]
MLHREKASGLAGYQRWPSDKAEEPFRGGAWDRFPPVSDKDAGFGAAYEMARILDGFRRELPEPNATYNVG